MPSEHLSKKGASNKESNREKMINRFIEEYQFSIAKSEEELEKALRLRHEVFLKEFNYDMHEDADKTLESDEYDRYSVHCLIEHKRSGMVAGCVRLVMPRQALDTASLDYLPVQKKGAERLNHLSLTPPKFSASDTCEVSRLAVSKSFRARKEAETHAAANGELVFFSQEEAQTFSLVSLGLFLCTYAVVGLTGRRHVFAMMEPRLPRLLSISGLRFTKISEAILYHGIRHAYYIDYLVAQHEISGYLRPLRQHIEKTLQPQINQAIYG